MLNLREPVSHGLFSRFSVAASILVRALSGLASDIRGYNETETILRGRVPSLSI
jgi:hypothetical protein